MSRGGLCRSHPQGREAGRPAGAGADQVRAGDQSQDRQGARAEVPATLLARADEVDRMKRRKTIGPGSRFPCGCPTKRPDALSMRRVRVRTSKPSIHFRHGPRRCVRFKSPARGTIFEHQAYCIFRHGERLALVFSIDDVSGSEGTRTVKPPSSSGSSTTAKVCHPGQASPAAPGSREPGSVNSGRVEARGAAASWIRLSRRASPGSLGRNDSRECCAVQRAKRNAGAPRRPAPRSRIAPSRVIRDRSIRATDASPPFRLRKAGVAAESAVARFQFRRAGCTSHIN